MPKYVLHEYGENPGAYVKKIKNPAYYIYKEIKEAKK